MDLLDKGGGRGGRVSLLAAAPSFEAEATDDLDELGQRIDSKDV